MTKGAGECCVERNPYFGASWVAFFVLKHNIPNVFTLLSFARFLLFCF